jgi:3-deoxy-D-manno-octulosonic-acid transferase
VPPSRNLPVEAKLATRATYAVYDAAGVLAALLSVPALPFLLRGGRGRGVRERLGRLPRPARGLLAPVWIHAASVGESRSAVPLAAELRRRRPGTPILVSTTTVAGREVARTALRPDAVTLLPLDALRIVDRVVRRLRPRCLILVELDLWPGLLRAAHRANVPVVAVSGRLSERSLRRYRWAAALFRAAIGHISAFGMQTEEDAARVVALGAAPACVRVTGSLKAGAPAAPPGAAPAAGLEGRRVLIAASTQPGEERFVLDACAGLWNQHPDLVLILAPRRPERFGEVDRLVAACGLRYERRSAMGGSVHSSTRVLLLDSVGELVGFLPLARAVFVGGSVAPLGGHNVLEPAAYGKAVAFGPHTENVAAAARALCDARAGALVREPAELAAFWDELLIDPEAAAAAGARALGVVGQGNDVLERTWALLAPWLGGDG